MEAEALDWALGTDRVRRAVELRSNLKGLVG